MRDKLKQKLQHREYYARPEIRERTNEYFRNYYKNNKVKHTNRTKAWRDKNLEKARKYAREYARNHPLEQRNQWLKRRYKITNEIYQVLLDSQNGRCAICGGDNLDNKRNKYLCVDHNHKTGQVRGLLCHSCNAAIGYARENIEFLNKMIEYLIKYL